MEGNKKSNKAKDMLRITNEKKYRGDIAQKDYVNKGNHKERSLKIGKDTNFEEYIRDKLLKDRYSTDVIIGTIKRKGLKFKGMICTKNLYNYIDAGIFSGISNENLWEKRKRRKRRYK
jgi:IS30 family transposase